MTWVRRRTAVLLRDALHIGARDAAGRVRLAAAVTPRRTLTGELVEAAHPQTAAALADRGDLDPARGHGRGDDRPDRRSARRPIGTAVRERAARLRAPTTTPTLLARFANGLYARVDQDGAFRDVEAAHRRRTLTLHRRPDGSGSIAGELTCEAAEYLETLFDTLAKPHQGPDGERDPRTPGQRRHDALLGGFKILYSSGSLPSANGCATTLVLTATVDEFADGTGIVQTAHGYAIPDRGRRPVDRPQSRSQSWCCCRRPRRSSPTRDQHRLFTEQQRLAMFARDKGCSYPGCDAPLSWTQAHHVTDYAKTKRTSVDDGTLVCTANHALFERMGWASIMLNDATPLGPAGLGRPGPATTTQPYARRTQPRSAAEA